MADEPTEQGTGPDEASQSGTGDVAEAPAEASEPAAAVQQPAAPDSIPERKSSEARKAALAQAIQNEVVQGGRIESQSDFQAVVVFGKPVNHILHLILTIVTCLVWGIVWIAMLIWGGEKRVMVSIDEYGNVLRQEIKK
jgi:hypothetical protein